MLNLISRKQHLASRGDVPFCLRCDQRLVVGDGKMVYRQKRTYWLVVAVLVLRILKVVLVCARPGRFC